MFHGERLEEIRKDNGMTQEDLAKLLDVSSATISSYERGEVMPKLANLLKLSEVLNISIDYLCGLVDEEISHSWDNVIILPRNTSPEFKKEVEHFISILKKTDI